MEIRLAEHYGMCFGVRDAVDLALRLTKQGPLTILGDLVHNPDVVAQMDAAGAVRVRQLDDVQTRAVLLTAHGTAQRVKLQLRDEGRQVHDATCPLVKRVHQAAARLVRDGYHPVVIGQAGHVEVRGIVGDLPGAIVILEEQDLDQLEGHTRLGIVAQTTQPLEHVLKLVDASRRRFPQADVCFIDTVCQPTKDRQESLRRLVHECDVLVVVGGPDSNNSRKLTELARGLGREAYQVANATELRSEWFERASVVGLTAGTSTPDRVIAEVRVWLEELPSQAPARQPLAQAVAPGHG
jgi:4-hydroxy-3-methylbut-2-enyl diphosphate reductase